MAVRGDVAEARSGERIIFRGHPSWRSMPGLHVKGFVLAVAAGVLAGLLSATADGHVAAGWVASAVLVVFAIVIATALARRRRTTYTITTRRLTIELGLLGREVQETRLERIQNVSSRQRPIERLLDVGAVSFDTAGEAGFDLCFHGVAHPRRIARTVQAALDERPLSHRGAQAGGIAQ